MKANAIILILLSAFFCLCGAGIFIVRDHYAAQELPILASSTEFALTNQDGAVFKSTTLKGQIWVANFFFSSCEGVCPTVNGAIARFASKVKDKNVRFVSISVDPDKDTVPVLSEYAKKFNADTARWNFLTGPEEEVNRILSSFKLGSADDPMQHTSRLVLVDASGKVRGYYQGTDDQAFDFLARDLNILLRT